MPFLFSYALLAALATSITAAPNPAVGYLIGKVGGHKHSSTASASSLPPSPPPHSSHPPSSLGRISTGAPATPVSSACDGYMTLNPQDPAIVIDAVGSSPIPHSPVITACIHLYDASTPTPQPPPALNPRNAAVDYEQVLEPESNPTISISSTATWSSECPPGFTLVPRDEAMVNGVGGPAILDNSPTPVCAAVITATPIFPPL